MKVHLIAIGGSAMHNIALALHHKGFEITGSDDAIFDPSKTRLEDRGLLPESFGVKVIDLGYAREFESEGEKGKGGPIQNSSSSFGSAMVNPPES